MDFLDDIIAKQIKSLPSDDGIYENYKNNYNRLKRDIKSFNRNEELVKKIAIFPKLSKRISDLKKIKKSEKKFLDFTNKMDQVIRGIKNKHNKEDFDDQILLKILRASDVYGRSLDNTKGFLHYISIIDKKELPELKTLLDKYVKVEQGLIDLIQILSDDDTQLPLIKKLIVKLEMESLYNLLSHKNVDFITEEYDRRKEEIFSDLKFSKDKIIDYHNKINEDIEFIEELFDDYSGRLSNDYTERLKELRHQFLKIRSDAADSRYIHGKLLAKENMLYDLAKDLASINKRAIPLNTNKEDAVITIKNIGLKRHKSKDYASQVREIQQLRNTLTNKNIKDSYDVIDHYKRYHIMKALKVDHV